MTAVDYVGAVCAYAHCDQPSEVATATVCTAGHLMHFGRSLVPSSGAGAA